VTALAAAEQLEREHGIKVEVIDPRTLRPLDVPAIVKFGAEDGVLRDGGDGVSDVRVGRSYRHWCMRIVLMRWIIMWCGWRLWMCRCLIRRRCCSGWCRGGRVVAGVKEAVYFGG